MSGTVRPPLERVYAANVIEEITQIRATTMAGVLSKARSSLFEVENQKFGDVAESVVRDLLAVAQH
jgi:hypothetical protein